ncbi:MAG TPA: tetratricopeptide repeat protein [Polyangia bacterium]|jgi:tetratricopeptide (TPR) repeat protein
MRGPALALALALCGAPWPASAGEPRQRAEAAGAGPTFWERAGRSAGPGAPREATAAWFAVAIARTNEGRYAEAAAAYGAAIAAGAGAPAVYSNLGEVLMAEGRLREAEGAYREAIAVAGSAPGATAVSLDDPLALTQELVLGYVGLAVSLDRDGQTRAAHETMRRALALDPTMAVLAVAASPDADLFFVPRGEVHYYLGLARAIAGRRDEAADAFRQFLDELPHSRWAPQARAHLAELEARAVFPPTSPAAAPSVGPGPATGPRVMAAGTVLATGGAAAPLIDAAWREQAAILDACLDAAPALAATRAPLRLAVEMTIDRRGRVTAAAVKLPSGIDLRGSAATLTACLEQAVVTHLRLPSAARSTRARTELLVGFSAR